MKKFYSFLMVALCFLTFGLVGCGKTKTINVPDQIKEGNEVAVLYFSRPGYDSTGNYHKIGPEATVASIIADELDCDLIQILPSTLFSENYKEALRQEMEYRENEETPEIKNHISLFNYKTIFIGFPIFDSDLPQIVKVFIENNNFSDKVIIPFCTSYNGSFGSSLVTLRNLLSENQFRQELGINQSLAEDQLTKEEIIAFVATLGI